MFSIENRRYTGNKNKLMPWIREKIIKECKNCHSFYDAFAGTGSVINALHDLYDNIIINDFLYSNEIIYKAFFLSMNYDIDKLNKICLDYNNLKGSYIKSNYFAKNYGNKFFSLNDSLIIGEIRDDIEEKYINKILNDKEYSILLASLIYSIDKIANTVGHYEAYRKNTTIKDNFKYILINPLNLDNKNIKIYRQDTNVISKKINSDIVFIDPPYNSRQYSRFYHLLENLVKWDKPKLYGVALKPIPENMSDYCRVNARERLEELVNSLKCKYIVLTYNNTYQSKSKSSKNKIQLDEIKAILENKGHTKVFYKDYKAFNSGKTNLNNHKEYLFVTEVNHGR